MKKVLILSAAILATSVFHASATTTAPSVLQSGRLRVGVHQQCGSALVTVPLQNGYRRSTAITADLIGGATLTPPGVWVTTAAFRTPLAPTVEVCLNEVNPMTTRPLWVQYTVAGPQG